MTLCHAKTVRAVSFDHVLVLAFSLFWWAGTLADYRRNATGTYFTYETKDFTRYIHWVRVDVLEPDTVYYFRTGCGTDDELFSSEKVICFVKSEPLWPVRSAHGPCFLGLNPALLVRAGAYCQELLFRHWRRHGHIERG